MSNSEQRDALEQLRAEFASLKNIQTDLSDLRTANVQLQATLNRQEQALQRQEQELARLRANQTESGVAQLQQEPGRTSRRKILKGMGAATAGLLTFSAAALTVQPAQALDGDPLKAGQDASPTDNNPTTANPTRLFNPSQTRLANVLFHADNYTNPSAATLPAGQRIALAGTSLGPDSSSGFKVGVYGQSDTGYGVEGFSNNTGVYGFSGGVSGIGVWGDSSVGYGVYAQAAGANAALRAKNAASGKAIEAENNASAATITAANSGSGDGLKSTSTGGNGVYGQTASGSNAVFGENTGGGYGVQGKGTNSAGIYGTSLNSYGVRAEINNTQSAVYGLNNGNGKGLEGNCNTGIGVFGNSNSAEGVFGNSNSGIGVRGISTNAEAIYGISSSTNATVYGSNNSTGAALFGTSTGGYGANLKGGQAAVLINPTGGSGAPITGPHSKGEIFADNNNALFYSVDDISGGGSAGVWRKLAGKQIARIDNPVVGGSESYLSAGTFHLLPKPDRYIDTRISLGGVPGPILDLTTRNFAITGRPGLGLGSSAATANGRYIPSGATAIAGVLTVLNPSVPLGSTGYVTIFAGNSAADPVPTVSNMVYTQSGVSLSVAFVVSLSAVGKINIYVRRKADILLDIQGYYL